MFVKEIKQDKVLKDIVFYFLEACGNVVVQVKYRDVWVVVDNGHPLEL